MDSIQHTTDALAVKGTSALAIVLAGIAAANRLTDEYEHLERAEKSLGHHFPANYFERAASEQSESYFRLLEVMPYLPATDLVEAAAQVGQAMSVIDIAYDELPDQDEVNKPFKKMQREVYRLLHSAIRAIEKAGGFSLAEMGLTSIRGENLDPWADVETVVRDLQAKGVK